MPFLFVISYSSVKIKKLSAISFEQAVDYDLGQEILHVVICALNLNQRVEVKYTSKSHPNMTKGSRMPLV